MNSRKTLALAEFPLIRDVASRRRSRPDVQQHTDDSGRNGIRPQELPQLVGFVIPMPESTKARTAAAVLASAA
jgi:hypothetical protein